MIFFVVVGGVKAFLVQNLKTLHEYKGHADNFICSVIPGAPFSSTQYTPGSYILPPHLPLIYIFAPPLKKT